MGNRVIFTKMPVPFPLPPTPWSWAGKGLVDSSAPGVAEGLGLLLLVGGSREAGCEFSQARHTSSLVILLDLDGERLRVMKMTMMFIWSAHSRLLPHAAHYLPPSCKTVNCSPASSTPLWPVAHVNQASTSDQPAGDRPCAGHRVQQ